MSPEDRKQAERLDEQLKTLSAKKPAPLPTTLGLVDAKGPPRKTFLLERGELSHAAAEVHAGFPIILSPNHQPAAAPVRTPSPDSTGRRTALAEWLTRPDHPLTARVLVNRLWQHHFGRGLVPTPNDFGVRGEQPTHPELLDWLAGEFLRSGWSIKSMHRKMLLSSAYVQSTEASPETRAKDPDNELFSRMNRQRLEGEVIRDSLLAVSGRLNLKVGGPGIMPPFPTEVPTGPRGWNTTPNQGEHRRRSVYIWRVAPALSTLGNVRSSRQQPELFERERSTTRRRHWRFSMMRTSSITPWRWPNCATRNGRG